MPTTKDEAEEDGNGEASREGGSGSGSSTGERAAAAAIRAGSTGPSPPRAAAALLSPGHRGSAFRRQRMRSSASRLRRFRAKMEVALQAGDAVDWVYMGEGAANLILSYTGSSPSMLGKVLQAKKVLNDKAQPAPNCVNFSSYEQLVWGDIPELIESVKQGSVAQAYAVHVMSQHLGHDHVDGGVRVSVSKDFLEIVGKNVLSARPAWRVNASAIDTNANSALLISDHSLFSGLVNQPSAVVTIEHLQGTKGRSISYVVQQEDLFHTAVSRPRWILAAAGRAHALPPLVRAVRSQRGRSRRRKMIHPAARYMRLPPALATGDPWGVGRRPPAACSHTRSMATTSPASLTSSSKPMASGSTRPKLWQAAAARVIASCSWRLHRMFEKMLCLSFIVHSWPYIGYSASTCFN